MELSRDKLVEKTKQYKFVPLIFAIFLIAVGLKYYPVRNIQYLQALDPYNLFRMSQQIAYTGGLPELDFMRNFPYATPTYVVHIGNLVIPAVLYWMGGFLFFDTYLDFAYITMPLFSGIAAVAMYFLGKELYDRYTGLGAAFFIAILPGTMFRASAGFFEKEATGTMLMIMSLLFFTLAWKRSSWIYGIASGLALGLFNITWGGSQMMWLLYPMIVGFMILIDQDIKQLIAAYTPTVLVAAGLGSIFNPHRFWFTDSLAVAAFALLALLWTRYLFEEFQILSKEQLPYFGVSTYLFGAIALLLSPFYSDTLASIMLRLYSMATQTGGSVIGGTVAENAPPELSQMVSQLGTGIVDQIFPGAEILTAAVGAWTFAFLAIPLMASTVLLMLGKRYNIVESLTGKKNYALTAGIMAAWALGFSMFFAGHRSYGLITAAITSVVIAAIVYYLDEDSAFTISSMTLLFTAVLTTMFAFSEQNTFAVLRAVTYPIWIATAGLGAIYYLNDFKPRDISLEWYKIIPLFWLGSNLLGATARSRLIYLAAFPVALGAGYTFSIVLNRLQELDFSEVGLNTGNMRFIAITLLIAGVLSINILAGWAAVQNIGGSPNEAWMQNLEYLEEEVPEGSVVMSWWDYGYHFQSIGRAGTVADGGNFRYFVGDSQHVNYHLADYFTSTNTSGHEEFLEKHSVDYLVLDNTMIGKYSAVSQIAERDNQNFDRMWQVQTSNQVGQPIPIEDAISQSENRSVATFRGQVEQWYANVYVPINPNEGGVEVVDSATLQLHTGERMEASCVLTDEGIEEFGDGESEFCVAIDPYYNIERGLNFEMQSRAIVLDRELAETTFAKLYLMDGYDIPYAEKVDGGSNDYVKMWEIE